MRDSRSGALCLWGPMRKGMATAEDAEDAEGTEGDDSRVGLGPASPRRFQPGSSQMSLDTEGCRGYYWRDAYGPRSVRPYGGSGCAGSPRNLADVRASKKRAAGRGLHALRRSPEGRCLRIFRLVVKNTQTRISYNIGSVVIVLGDVKRKMWHFASGFFLREK